jgi:hypothetical protein
MLKIKNDNTKRMQKTYWWRWGIVGISVIFVIGAFFLLRTENR